MKCPKCGFTSFDFLDSCKKCGATLEEHKSRFGIRSLLFPTLAATPDPAADDSSEKLPAAEEVPAIDAREATDFGFDFLATSDEPTGAEPEAEPPAAPAAEPAGLTEEPSFDDGDFPADLGETESPPGAGDFEAEDPEVLFAGADDFSFDDFDAETGEDAKDERPDKKNPPAESELPDPFESREPAVAGPAPDTFPGQALPSSEAPGTSDADLPPLPADAFPPEIFAGVAAPQATSAVVAAAAVLPGPGPGPDPEPFPAGVPAATDDDPAAAIAFCPGPLTGRLAAFLIDLLVLGALFALFLVLGKSLLHPAAGHGLLPDLNTLVSLSTPYFLLLFVLCFAYFSGFHLLLGQTPGKMAFGLEVETLDGRRPSPAQAFLRSTGGLASFCLLGAGFLGSLFDAEGRGLNDRLAGTRVVDARAAEEAQAG